MPYWIFAGHGANYDPNSDSHVDYVTGWQSRLLQLGQGLTSEAIPPLAGPFDTLAFAKAWQAGEAKAGMGSPSKNFKDLYRDPISALLGFLGQQNLWIRILEVGAGFLLLAIGTTQFLKGSPVRSVAKTATKVIR